MQKSQQLFFGLRLVSRMFEENQQPAIQAKKEQPFGEFFQQIKVRQPIGRKYSIQTVIQQAGGWIHFCMKGLRNLKSFQIFKTEITKSKTYCSRCPC